MTIAPTASSRIFLSTVPAGNADRGRAGAAIAVFVTVFLAVAPFAQTPLPQIWAFIPSYQSALFLSDLITAVLLFAQFTMLRDASLLALAVGYLFTAMMAVAHALTFPGLLAPEGWLGAGPQTTAWMYMAWHAGFPIAVLMYVVSRVTRKQVTGSRRDPRIAVAVGAAAALVTVCIVTAAMTIGKDLLPAIMQDHHYTGAMLVTVSSVCLLSIVALLAVWWRRPHSVLDVWLMVVMVAWLCDIGLSAGVNAGRFDLGFYAGRIFGLLAASFVLLALLLETGGLYARVAREFEAETAAQESRLRDLQDELIHIARLNELGQMVSALTHELNQPLTAANNYIAAAQALATIDPAKSAEVLNRAGEQLSRAGQVIDRLRQQVKKSDVEHRPEDLASTITEAMELALAGGQGRGVVVNTSLDPSLPPVLIDRVQIQQVLLNLVRNAVEAMSASPRRELLIATAPLAAGLVEVTVADTGPGLAPAVREKLFEPFLTTKATGLGVGLSICRTIIESHGGRIWATDNPGGGTVFHFVVPGLVAIPEGDTGSSQPTRPVPAA